MDDSQRNRHLYNNSNLSDVVLTFGDERIHAHKDILRSKLSVDVTQAIIYCLEYLLCVQRFEEPSPRALDSVISSVISLFEEYVIIDETLIDATALFCLQRRYNVMQKCSCSAAQCIKRPTELGAGYTMRYKYSTTDPSLRLLVEKMSVIDLDIDPDDFGFLESGTWHGFGR